MIHYSRNTHHTFGLVLLVFIIALLIASIHQHIPVAPVEPFECKYAYKLPATSRGCFSYRAKATDTCETIQTKFKTTNNNVTVPDTGDYCTSVSVDDVFRVCPSPESLTETNCIYKMLPYATTCAKVATEHDTSKEHVHYYDDSNGTAPDTMLQCQSHTTAKETVPARSRIRICATSTSTAPADSPIINSITVPTLSQCKSECDNEPRCTHMLYGNGTCKLMHRETPLMNIVSSGRETEAYRCSPTKTLQYAGALPSEVGDRTHDGDKVCKWLGGQGRDARAGCLAPYTSPKTSACAWESIVAQHPEIMEGQSTYEDVDQFLGVAC